MKKQPHILILHPHFVISGGAGKFALEVGQRLVSRGFRVSVVSMRHKAEIIRSANQVDFYSVGGPLTSSFWFWLFYPFWLWRVFRLIDQLQPDILFPQVFPAQWWAGFYKYFHPKTKIIWMCPEPSAFIHSKTWIDAIKSPTKKFVAKFFNQLFAKIDLLVSQKIDFFIANSRYSLEQITKTYSLEQDLIEVAYPGVSQEIINSPVNLKREKIVISVARLSEFKNLDFLIKVFVEFQKSLRQQWQFYIIGEGEDKERLGRVIGDYGARDSIKIKGAVSDGELRSLLSKSSLFLSGAIEEPFGIAVVEAQASGAVVVAHNSGGPKETVKPGKSGVLVDKLEINDYLQAMLSCLYQGIVKDELVKGAYKQGRGFDWDKPTEVIERVIRQVID